MENNEGRSKPSSKQNVKLKYSSETPAVGNSYRGAHNGATSHGCSIWRMFLNQVRVRSRQPGCIHQHPNVKLPNFYVQDVTFIAYIGPGTRGTEGNETLPRL